MADIVNVGIRTFNGNYVTAINGGGIREDANALPIHTDAVVVQDWEKFEIFFDDNGFCTIGTSGAYYLTAVHGGGLQVPPTGSPVATDRTEILQWKHSFSNNWMKESAFKTYDGHYLSAVNGGGMATAGAPLHTDQTQVSAFEMFMLVPVRDEPTPTPKLAAIESESCEK